MPHSSHESSPKLSEPTPTKRATTTGGEDVFLQLGTKLWLAVAAILIQSLLARWLEPAGRGSYAVCLMFGPLLAVLCTPAVDRASQYYVISGRQSLSTGMSAGGFLSVIGAGLALAIAWPLIHSSIPYFQKAELSAFYISLPLIATTLFDRLSQLHAAGQRRFKQLALFTVVQTTANIAGILLLVVYLGMGVPGALLSFVAAQVILVLLTLADLRSHFRLEITPPRVHHLKEILGYGSRYHLTTIGTRIETQAGTLFLAFLATQEEIGLFSAAFAVVLRVLTVADSIDGALSPRVALDPEGRPALVAQCARISVLLTGSALAVVVALSTPIVRILLSDSFLPAVPLIWVLAIGALFSAAAKVLMTYFRGTNHPGVCSWATWIGLVVNATVTVLLYPHIGAAGAAWGMSVGLCTRTVFLAWMFSSLSGWSACATWCPTRSDAEMILLSAKKTWLRATRA